MDEDEVGEEGWLYGSKEGKMGWVTENYVAKIETRLPPPPPLPTTQRGRSPTRRATRQKQAPDTHYMAPLMDQGGNQDPVYTPWCHRDMKYLYTSLPPITGGANAWIRSLENNSVADNLAMGDVRAILTKSTSVPATQQIEHAAGTSHLPDAHPFDPHRPRYWEAIRAAYPTRNAMTAAVTKRLNDEKKADKEKLKVASILNVSEAQQPQSRPAPQDHQQQDTQRHHVPDYQQPRNGPRGYQRNPRRSGYQARPEEYQGRDRQRRGQDSIRACFFCESPDHWVRDCREYSNYQAGRQGTQRPPHSQPQQKAITNAVCPLYGED